MCTDNDFFTLKSNENTAAIISEAALLISTTLLLQLSIDVFPNQIFSAIEDSNSNI